MDTPTASLAKYKMFIGGEWTDAVSGATFETQNPFTGKSWALIPRASPEDVDRAVRAAHKAFTEGDWPKLTATQRGALLRKLGDLIGPNAKHLAEIEVRDNGKLISEMSVQTAYMAQWYYYFGGLADKVEGAVLPLDKHDVFNYTRHEPLGVVAALVPWNSPGTVWVNTYRAVSFMSPFGGYKRSGIGRELIKEFLQTKSVWISTATEVPNPFILR